LLKPAFEINGQPVRTSACIGIGVFPDGNESGQLLQQADCAMYAAKRSGKSRIVHFGDDLGSAARERLTLEGELQDALAKGEISVHYQPEFDLATNSIVRFEALARWTHPRLGQIVPVSFIPIAEESGLIIPLGAHIMKRPADTLRPGRKSPIAPSRRLSTYRASSLRGILSLRKSRMFCIAPDSNPGFCRSKLRNPPQSLA
jgi:predicted signal transduction protein with EAL and GGDEF domain